MLAYLEKMKDILFILVVTAAYSVIAHTVGSNGDLAAGSIGALVLVVITVIGIVISWLPGFKMLPMVFWVSIVAVVVSMPQFPLSDWILAQTKNVEATVLAHRSGRFGSCRRQLHLCHGFG